LNEEIIDVISINDFSLDVKIVFATKKGKIKKTMLKDFEISRISKKSTAIKLDNDDLLVTAKPSNNNQKIILITSLGKAVKYNENEINIQGPKSKGIKGISLPKSSFVTAMCIA
jgi:topoisomerase-4 subunit A